MIQYIYGSVTVYTITSYVLFFVISDVNLYIELLITERQYIQTVEVGLYIKCGGKCVCSKKLVHTCQLTDFCRSHN
jgi:hypothetical protein